LEKNSPLVSERIEIIKKILEKNIKLRIHIGPFIPYLSSFENIIKNLPEGIKEINVELYNSKMGNLEDLTKKIQRFSKDLSKKILDIYKDKENYLNFSKNLEEEIKKYKEKGYKFCYIVPEFDSFYNNIDYNKFI
jgi:DNA repair photolyase